MGALIYQWIDFLWLPLAWFTVVPKFRLHAACFVLACLMTMRLLADIYESIGHPAGFLPFFDTPVYTRGLIFYSVIMTLYLLLAHYSPRTRPIVFFAANLSIYMMSLILCLLIMAI
jgi:hypothetical protein